MLELAKKHKIKNYIYSNPMIASTLNHIRSLSIRRKSTAATAGANHGAGGASNGHNQPSSRKKSTDRTTRLLIVILVLFLITEFPQVSILLALCSPNCVQIWKGRDRKTVFCRVSMRHKKCRAKGETFLCQTR